MSKTVYSLLIVLLYALGTSGQVARSLVFKNLSISDIAPIYDIDQDDNGIVWISTNNGLYSFDGYRCIPHNTAKTENIGYCVFAHHDEILMGGIQGISVYNKKFNKYISVKGFQPRNVKDIKLQGNKIFVGGAQGLFLYDYYRNVLKLVTPVPKNVLSLAVYGNKILIGTFYGCYLYDGRQCRKLLKFSSKIKNSVSAIEYDTQKKIFWIGTFNHLYRYDIKTNTLALDKNAGNMIVKSLKISAYGLWISTDDGVYLYKQGKLNHIIHDSRNPSSLGNDIAWSVFLDKWGNVLFGTEDGLSTVYHTDLMKYCNLGMISGSYMGNVLTNFYYDSRGIMWLGGTNGVIKLAKDVTWYRRNDSLHTISHNKVRKIYEDSSHNLWICTDIGLNLYDQATGIMHPKIILDNKKNYEVPWIYDIQEDNLGRLWVATYDDGIYIVDKKQLISSKFYCKAICHISKGLHSTFVLHLAKGRNNKILAVTSKGVNIIDEKFFNISSLSKDQADALMVDHYGFVWVANSKGITEYDNSNHIVKRLSFNSNLHTSKVSSLLEINGNIWVVTPTVCAILKHGKWLSAFKVPYLHTTCAYYSNKVHKVFFGGTDGFVTLDVNKIVSNKEQNSFMLSDLWINGKRYQPENKYVTYMNSLTLNYNENNLEFFMTDVPLRSKMRSLYAYRLKGLDNNLHYIYDVGNIIGYYGLPYGNYILEIYLVKGFSNVDKKVYSLNINILPPWYFSILAKTIYLFLLISFLVWMINFYHTRHILKMERIAKQRVIEASNSKMKFYKNLSKSLQKGLGNIMSGIIKLAEKAKEESTKSDFERLEFDATQLNAYIRYALDIEGESNSHATSTGQHINIIRYCHAIVTGLHNEAARRHINLRMKTKDTSITYVVNPIEWDIVFYILMKSAIDYSDDNANILLTIVRDIDSHSLMIKVSSDMFLVTEQQLPYFFLRYSNLLGKNVQNKSQDMYKINDYVMKHQGHLNIMKDEKGTVVIKIEFEMNETNSNKSVPNDLSKKLLLDKTDEKLMKKITEVIEANLSDSNFNVTKLQVSIGVGSKLLYRKIKQTTNMSPVEYIRYIRIKQASLLLAQGRFSISEVMYMVGFSNSGYFSKCFYKEFGMTPTKYVHQN